MNLYRVLLVAFFFSVVSARSRLGWDYWRGNHPVARPPVGHDHKKTSTQRPRTSPSTSQNVVSVRCGTSRNGNQDPLDLINSNHGVWSKDRLFDVASMLPGFVPGNFSVRPTIVGGQEATPTEICWQAKLQSNGFSICGGSIIGPRTILTAAHCVLDLKTGKGFKPSRFKVVVGAPASNTYEYGKNPDPDHCAQELRVVRIVSNSRYDREHNENDIAILTLDKDIDFRKPCVCPVCLEPTREPVLGEICAVSGYGYESEDGKTERNPTPLKMVHVNIMNTRRGANCPLPEADDRRTPDIKNFLCAGDKVGEDSCSGDSGGPIVCFNPKTQKHYQVGVVSAGSGCGRGIGGLYTRVSRYYEWIRINSGGDLYTRFLE